MVEIQLQDFFVHCIYTFFSDEKSYRLTHSREHTYLVALPGIAISILAGVQDSLFLIC